MLSSLLPSTKPDPGCTGLGRVLACQSYGFLGHKSFMSFSLCDSENVAKF